MSQAEGQQKNLVHSIDSLPTRGPLSCLDQDLLLLKATSAATLSCLGECLNILQQTQSHNQAPSQPSERHHAAQRAPSGESAPDPISVLVLEPLTPVTSPIHHVFSVPSSSGLWLLSLLDGYCKLQCLQETLKSARHINLFNCVQFVKMCMCPVYICIVTFIFVSLQCHLLHWNASSSSEC